MKWNSFKIEISPFLLGILLIFLLPIQIRSEEKEEPRTLYLRDGSVLKGEILKDSMGNYIVCGSYGEFNINVNDVIYIVPEDQENEQIRETFLIEGKDTEVISILQKEIPQQEEGIESFNLLIHGDVEGIYDTYNTKVKYTRKAIGSLSRVTIRYEDILPESKNFFITTRQKNFLKKDEKRNYLFNYKFTPDQALVIKLMVKYPKEWSLQDISPEPTRSFEGLIVWEKNLKRQQSLTPLAVFKPSAKQVIE
jgi:hypothetical protein